MAKHIIERSETASLLLISKNKRYAFESKKIRLHARKVWAFWVCVEDKQTGKTWDLADISEDQSGFEQFEKRAMERICRDIAAEHAGHGRAYT